MDTLVKSVLVLFISVISFASGAYVGKKVADEDRKRIEAVDKVLHPPAVAKYVVGQCLLWTYKDEFESDAFMFYVHGVGEHSYMLYNAFNGTKDTSGLGRIAESFETVDEQYRAVPCP